MDGRRRTLLLSVGLMTGMLGLVAASVPLYRLFCQVTGYAGTPRVVAGNSDVASNTRVTVRFDTNVMPDMPWRFKAEATSMSVRLGETTLALFTAENTSKEPLVGTAVFNVTPLKAARYVDKIQCFCFTQQRLEPGQKAEMPVSFFIDPAILKDQDTFDVRTLTLSYTFYRSHDQTAGVPEGSNRGAGAVAKEVKEGKS